MIWNQDTERLDAALALEDAPPNEAVALLVDARKRAFNAEYKAQQLKAELDALKAAHAWIKTSEQMPVSRESVLGIDGYGEVAQVSYSVPYLWTYDNSDRRPAGAVTHWMPLPEAPK